ncbi:MULTISPECIES: CoA transferase [unclassified Microbacterium]|uniref:CoA transferase n=1 Tax=unclassified Microbacterium TaxID=2609290 RepID=UPI000EA84028|nr:MULTISPECIES: CoA transferase [unclassified Microbacterium]MBT2486674.1 CoA transferase [Microbacterium sp. ISL-108]RKN64615.1 carnitine dehydratase [Microbacterium sp. CGR2]
MTPAAGLLARVWAEITGDPLEVGSVDTARTAVPLPSVLATGDFAWASVGAVTLACGGDLSRIDPLRVATSYRSDRFLLVDGAPPPVWSPMSGFWRTADGWIRTHGNYPHHAAALRVGLSLDDVAGADQVRDALLEQSSARAVAAITAAGGLAVPVLMEQRSVDAALRRTPVLDVQRHVDPPLPRVHQLESGRLPLSGIRVVDLTRVIAGPVCTRTLALLGASVLRVDPPRLPEPHWQHFDTGHGKRSALLDARSDRMHQLIAEADVVVLGYRPAALRRLGLDPEDLVERHPGLIIAQLSAWGVDQPSRAGFDSLVQAESGIASIESPDGDRPGTLPAQALDHSAGYLLAAAVTTLLRRRARDGGSWLVRTSLRRIAAELLGMPRRSDPQPEVDFDVTPHLARFDVGSHTVTTSRPALPGYEFSPPRPWGADEPVW